MWSYKSTQITLSNPYLKRFKKSIIDKPVFWVRSVFEGYPKLDDFEDDYFGCIREFISLPLRGLPKDRFSRETNLKMRTLIFPTWPIFLLGGMVKDIYNLPLIYTERKHNHLSTE